MLLLPNVNNASLVPYHSLLGFLLKPGVQACFHWNGVLETFRLSQRFDFIHTPTLSWFVFLFTPKRGRYILRYSCVLLPFLTASFPTVSGLGVSVASLVSLVVLSGTPSLCLQEVYPCFFSFPRVSVSGVLLAFPIVPLVHSDFHTSFPLLLHVCYRESQGWVSGFLSLNIRTTGFCQLPTDLQVGMV